MLDHFEDRILILDFGSQYVQLIARRLRELNVYSEILPFDVPVDEIIAFQPKGIILSGGPESVTLDCTARIPDIVFQLGRPILGICYGMQALVIQNGGKVETAHLAEYGDAQLEIVVNDPLWQHIPQSSRVWMSHQDRVIEMPSDFKVIASTKAAPMAAIVHQNKPWYGLQFHPEVTHTEMGLQVLQNFVNQVCQCDGQWITENIIAELVACIKTQVGDDKVILALSGGIDSSVVAALLHKAIGDQLICIFVDTGLLRVDDQEVIKKYFSNYRVETVEAKAQFLNALKGIEDPEMKRKIIGEQFIRVFEVAAKKHADVKYLAQGTIYPDVVESAKTKWGKAEIIKSHHNVGGLPARMHLTLVEPLRELFKDEVRKIGLALGFSKKFINRHPFPGPGLAIRILGEVKPEYVRVLQNADAIFIEELKKHDLYDRVNQAFCVFLPIKTVGVKGDARVYEYIIALRAVETVDFMTACWARLSSEFLTFVSHRIMAELKQISRVVYDISDKPPATIEWE
jgi:GMP synthase (glutamine-hydrolysing)